MGTRFLFPDGDGFGDLEMGMGTGMGLKKVPVVFGARYGYSTPCLGKFSTPITYTHMCNTFVRVHDLSNSIFFLNPCFINMSCKFFFNEKSFF